MSFSVGTHLIPHPKKVSAHQKPPLCSLMRTTFNGRKEEEKRCSFLHGSLTFQVLAFLKVDRGGEDAFFVSNYNGGVIAVADGVSGYETQDSLVLYSQI